MEETLSPEIFQLFFSAFSAHTVEYKGVLYKTAEHAYHCQRYTDPKIAEEIQNAPSVEKAWEISQKYKSQQLPDFDARKIGIMEEIFRAKLLQHKDVKQKLIRSGNTRIIKKHPLDYFWGTGADNSGRNEMGRLWMKLRAELLSR